MQIPSFDMALNNRLREQPNCLPGDVFSPLLSPVNRASFPHALGFAWPDWSLDGRRVARHRAGGYANHLDEIGFVDDKTPMALSPTLSDRVLFEGVALQGGSLFLSNVTRPGRGQPFPSPPCHMPQATSTQHPLTVLLGQNEAHL